MGAEQSTGTAVITPEAGNVGGERRPDVLVAAAAGLVVGGAIAGNAGPEELPDVENHPRIQYTHTIGNDHYPLERPLFSSIRRR